MFLALTCRRFLGPSYTHYCRTLILALARLFHVLFLLNVFVEGSIGDEWAAKDFAIVQNYDHSAVNVRAFCMTWSSLEMQQPDSIERQEQVRNMPTTTAPRALYRYDTDETKILCVYSVYSVCSLFFRIRQYDSRSNTDIIQIINTHVEIGL